MKYSEVKARILILRKHHFRKFPKFGFYERVYVCNNWNYRQCFSSHDFYRFESTDKLDDYLGYLYEKNMNMLLKYVTDDYFRKINFK